MLYPYPTALPTDAIMAVVIDALRGRVPEKFFAIHCVWQVSGYVAAKIETQPVIARGAAHHMSVEEACSALESLRAKEGVAQTITIPWNLLLPILLKLIQQILDGQTS